MIVVDDIPRIKRWKISFTDYRFHGISKKIYGSHSNVTLIHRTGTGSKSATISALQEAMKRGLDLVFLHLDDNVYLPILSDLVKKSIYAFEHNPSLQEIKLTDWPILSYLSNPSKGNLSCISVEGDRVSFEQNTFMPVRYRDYTLWVSYYHEDMAINYWAISLWSAIYKTDFLYDLLTNPALDNDLHLVDVEAYYANHANFKKETIPGG